MTNDTVISELKRLAQENGGVLHPSAVVKAAEQANSVLHSYFEWDDTDAAQKYREQQARQLIRVSVKYLTDDPNREPERVFVSLPSDRVNHGGYRVLTDVLTDDRMRSELLRSAWEELSSFTRRYKHLEELVAVFQAIEQTKDKVA